MQRISLNPVTVSGLWWSKKIPPPPELPLFTPIQVLFPGFLEARDSTCLIPTRVPGTPQSIRID